MFQRTSAVETDVCVWRGMFTRPAKEPVQCANRISAAMAQPKSNGTRSNLRIPEVETRGVPAGMAEPVQCTNAHHQEQNLLTSAQLQNPMPTLLVPSIRTHCHCDKCKLNITELLAKLPAHDALLRSLLDFYWPCFCPPPIEIHYGILWYGIS